jgi:hypothetical protein
MHAGLEANEAVFDLLSGTSPAPTGRPAAPALADGLGLDPVGLPV